jgi:hypothetical protein
LFNWLSEVSLFKGMTAKTFRDPVHDVITWKQEGEVGRLICALIGTPQVQRLRHIRQLGLASYVYHGAEHSRFSHSVGVCHVSRRMCDALGVDDPLDRAAVISAALLHDIGHAPFSHAMERVFGFDHEDYSLRLVRDISSPVHELLTEMDGGLPERVAGLLSGDGSDWRQAIVSSQMDADRFDYLLRDAHMTGVKVGRYDLERILLMLRHDGHGLLVDEGAFESLEGYLVARYHMYRLVYFHRAVRAAESMLERMFARARFLLERGDGSVLVAGALGALMRGEVVDAASYVQLGDYSAWSVIAQWMEHPDPVLSRLSRGLMERRLFRSVERRLDHGSEADDEQVARVMDELSAQERFLFVVDEARDLPYRPYRVAESLNQAIRMVDRRGRTYPIEERSELAAALGQGAYRLRRWCFDEALRSKIRRIVGEI